MENHCYKLDVDWNICTTLSIQKLSCGVKKTHSPATWNEHCCVPTGIGGNLYVLLNSNEDLV